MSRFYHLFLLVFIVILSQTATANNNCFANAASYYEQMYCQIKAEGSGRHLPGFRDFSINNELTQALLLKPYARELGIPLTMPRKISKPEKVSIKGADIEWVEAEPSLSLNPGSTVKLSPGKPSRVEAVEIEKPEEQASSEIRVIQPEENTSTLQQTTNCILRGKEISCPNNNYSLLENMENKDLDDLVLTDSNKMQIPEFTGSHDKQQDVNAYLRQAYAYYINKMLDIGLAGKTLSFGKFASLFNEMNRKGIDFRERFSTMYRYLKKDKASMMVETVIELPQTLKAEDCSPLEDMMICDHANANYIFKLQG